MLIDPANFVSLHLRWLIVFVTALAASAGWYAWRVMSSERWPGGGSTVGLVLGAIAAVLIVFEAALWVRRTSWFRASRWLGSAQWWMKAHIWLGLLVGPLALMHSGFSFGGGFTTVLMWVLAIVIGSGIVGLVVQNVVPRWMLEQVTEETVFSQIDLVQGQYASEAEHLVSLACEPSGLLSPEAENRPLATVSDSEQPAATIVGAVRRTGKIVERTPEGVTRTGGIADPQVLRQAFRSVIQPYLERRGKEAKHLASRRKSADYFAVLRRNTGSDAAPVVDALEQLCRKSRELDLQRRLHYLLHGWLAVHLPLSIALLILLTAHIVFALRFG